MEQIPCLGARFIALQEEPFPRLWLTNRQLLEGLAVVLYTKCTSHHPGTLSILACTVVAVYCFL